MWTLFEILINVYQGALMVYFLRRQLRMKRKGPIPDVVCVGAVALFFSLYLFWDIPILDTTVFLIPFVYSLFVSDERWGTCLLWNLAMAGIFTIAATCVTAFYLALPDVTWELMMQPTGLRIAFVVSGNLFISFLLFAISHFRRDNSSISWLTLGVFLLQLFLLLVVVELLFTLRLHITIEYDSIFIAACVCVLLCCLLALVLYDILAKSAERQIRTQTQLEHARTALQHQDEMRDIYNGIAALHHDMKHHMQVIERLLEDQNVPEAKRYFDSFRKAEQSFPFYKTGNIAVDALLTTKTILLRQKGIALHYEPYPLNELPIEESSFCSLIGNLMDNAIEAIDRMQCQPEAKVIRLSFIRNEDMLLITCENPMDPSTLRKNGDFFATSKSGKLHGFGMHSIADIARKAQGYCSFEPRGAIFHAEVVLPFMDSKRGAAV